VPWSCVRCDDRYDLLHDLFTTEKDLRNRRWIMQPDCRPEYYLVTGIPRKQESRTQFLESWSQRELLWVHW